MKSKEILPEDVRMAWRSLFPLDNPLLDIEEVEQIYDALMAAENEIEENLNQFTETFKKKDDELREKVIRIQELKKEIKEYKKLANAKEFKELARRLKERVVEL